MLSAAYSRDGNTPMSTLAKDRTELRDSKKIFSNHAAEEQRESRSIKIEQTTDFFGFYTGQESDEKNESVLEIYKLIFRFSIERLITYLSEDTFLVILLSYIRSS